MGKLTGILEKPLSSVTPKIGENEIMKKKTFLKKVKTLIILSVKLKNLFISFLRKGGNEFVNNLDICYYFYFDNFVCKK